MYNNNIPEVHYVVLHDELFDICTYEGGWKYSSYSRTTYCNLAPIKFYFYISLCHLATYLIIMLSLRGLMLTRAISCTLKT